ncbi:ankyrin repeat domain-containing protein [Salinisphaera sp. G21_0]|uniref:ankyrin repeat domain-containing protein n=1 Tax=Salinisphaera sp. G21_0 TaxID=2821094 RepID=UPI001ADB5B10|nr:ankyrin repeat domain-containing protein [Salinisphaera sp. G21_0]MBO9484065.1 ankyrin repeat domain-containing protein [Salinisphaera sp. G21_0]
MDTLAKAAADGDLAKVETLLASGANPNILGYFGYTPLHHAAHFGHHAIAKILLAYGADPNLKRMGGLTALQSAVDSGHLDVFKTLLPVTHQLDWNSLLQKFSRHGWEDQVKMALAKGADPNMPGVDNFTPLHDAAANGRLAIVKTLLASGAKPNILRYSNATPLHDAAAAGHHAIVKILLANGADPNLKEKHGQTAWQCAGPATKNIIQNFISVPRFPSLKSRCRSSIRGRLIKHLDRNKLPMKQAVKLLPLPYSVRQYIYLPLLT